MMNFVLFSIAEQDLSNNHLKKPSFFVLFNSHNSNNIMLKCIKIGCWKEVLYRSTRSIVVLVVAMCWCRSGVVSSAASSSYNAYNYDLTTPLFTPDGRLLQVEYAFESSRYSSPLLAIPCCDGIVLATTPNYCSRHRRHQQTRFVELLGTTNTTMAVVGLSGVIADNMALLQHARRHVDSWTRSYGSSSVILRCNPARRIADVVGDACQTHALGGGIRPFGASLLVCSVQQGGRNQQKRQSNQNGDDAQTSEILATVAITHPSGAVHSTTVTCTAKPNDNKNDPTPVFVVGGTTDVQKKIKQRVLNLCRQDSNSDILSFKRTVHIAIEALLEEYDTHKQQQKQQNEDKDNDDNSSTDETDAQMEIVIMSPTHGTYRLTQRDTRVLVSRVREQQHLSEKTAGT